MTVRRLTLLALVVLSLMVVYPISADSSVYAQGGDGVRPLDGGGEDEGDGGEANGGIVETIKKTVTNITRIVVPGRTMFDALNRVLAIAIAGGQNDVRSTYSELVGVVSTTVASLFDAASLDDVAGSTRPLAAGLAAPLFLLRLAIYHWRKLVGEEDTPARVIGDWIIAGGWAYIAGHLVTWVLSFGISVTGRAFGSNLPQLIANFLLSVSPIGMGLNALVQHNFLGGITTFMTGLGIVAAAVGLLWAFAVVTALSYVLAAIGPVVGVAGVVPQIRWIRALWLKALTLIAIFPLGAAAIFKATAVVSNPLTFDGPVGAVIRLIWLWGAVGFLFALAGIAGRFSIGTGMEVAGQMVKAGKAVVELGVMAGATGGAGLVAGAGTGALGASNGAAMGGNSGQAAGVLGAGSNSASGGSSGAATNTGGGGSAPMPAGGTGDALLDENLKAADALGDARTHHRQARQADSLGMRRAGNFFRSQAREDELRARRHELSARLEQYVRRESTERVPGADDVYSGESGDNSNRGGDPSITPTKPSPDGPRGGAPGAATPQMTEQSGNPTPRTSSSAAPPTTGSTPPQERRSASSRISSADSASTGSQQQEGGQPQSTSLSDNPLEQVAVSQPVADQFAAGFRDGGGTVAEGSPPDEPRSSRPAIKQLRDDLTALSGNDASFQTLLDAGPREMGQLAAAYHQTNVEEAPTPGERMQRALDVAYKSEPERRSHRIAKAIDEIVGEPS